MAIHPNQKLAYVIDMINNDDDTESEIRVFAVNSTGKLRSLRDIERRKRSWWTRTYHLAINNAGTYLFLAENLNGFKEHTGPFTSRRDFEVEISAFKINTNGGHLSLKSKLRLKKENASAITSLVIMDKPKK